MRKPILLAAMAAALTAVVAYGQTRPISTDGSDPAKWDPKGDATIAASANHKIIFENSEIRVLDVTVPAGTTEKLHHHSRPSVLVLDRAVVGTLFDHNAKGERQLAPAMFSTGSVVLLPPQAAHAIENRDTKAAHLIRIEFKHGAPRMAPGAQSNPISTDGSDPANWDPKRDAVIAAPESHKIIFENPEIRVLSVTVEPGKTEKLHHHRNPSVIVFDQAEAGTRFNHTAKGDVVKVPDLFSTGAVVLSPPEAAHASENRGATQAHLIRIEFKHGSPRVAP